MLDVAYQSTGKKMEKRRNVRIKIIYGKQFNIPETEPIRDYLLIEEIVYVC